MHGLAQIHHDVIGDIDDGRNAVDADAAQALAQPRGRLRIPLLTPRITRDANSGQAAGSSRRTGKVAVPRAATGLARA